MCKDHPSPVGIVQVAGRGCLSVRSNRLERDLISAGRRIGTEEDERVSLWLRDQKVIERIPVVEETRQTD